MPKFGKIWFNGYYFGDDTPVFSSFKKSVGRVALGFQVRKQLGKRLIFRVQKSDTRYDVPNGLLLQDKYKYVVPGNINNPQGQAARNALSAAVSNWKNILTAAEKAKYNKIATRRGGLTGFNLYVGEYIEANA